MSYVTECKVRLVGYLIMRDAQNPLTYTHPVWHRHFMSGSASEAVVPHRVECFGRQTYAFLRGVVNEYAGFSSGSSDQEHNFIELG